MIPLHLLGLANAPPEVASGRLASPGDDSTAMISFGPPHYLACVRVPERPDEGWAIWGSPDTGAYVALRPIHWTANPHVAYVQAEALWRGREAVHWDSAGVGRLVTGEPVGVAALERIHPKLRERIKLSIRSRIGFCVDRKLPAAVVALMEFSETMARFDESGLRNEAGQRLLDNERLLAIRKMLYHARVVQVPSSMVLGLFDQAWRAVHEAAGVTPPEGLDAATPFYAPLNPAGLPLETPEKRVAYLKKLHDVIQTVPFPDGDWPFDTLFLGWSSPLGIPEGTLEWKTRKLEEFAGARVKSLGILASQTEHRAAELLAIDFPPPKTSAYLPLGVYDGEAWLAAFSMLSMILGAVIADLRTRAMLVPEGLRPVTPPRPKQTKARRPPPPHVPPYYPIHLERLQIVPLPPCPQGDLPRNEEGEAVVQPRSYSFRWDRRGHERVYFRTGIGKPTAQDRAYLARLGYRMVEPGDAYAEDLRRLQDRGRVLTEGQWVALKVRWIPHAVCGPEGLPYKPAVRIVQEDL